MAITTRTAMEPAGRFGIAFAQALEKNGTNLVEFARTIDCSYENLRKVYKGLSLPGRFVVEMAVKHLGMNRDEADRLVVQDKLEKKYGKKAVQSAYGRHPRSGEFDALVPHLTDSQLEGVLAQMRALMSMNRKHAKSK